MAFERIGVGGVIRLDVGQSVAAMGRAQRAFGGLTTGALQFRSSLRQVTMALPAVALSLGGLVAPTMAAYQEAIKFQHAMGGVAAVAQTTDQELKRLSRTALDFSLLTVFSASQIASAEQELAKIGYDATETMKALPGVLAAAAAEEMPLARAAEIVGMAVRGMALSEEQSIEVADLLAHASARTATTISELGGAFVYAVPQARTMNMSLKEVVASIAAMSQVGVRGAMAGTGLRNVLVRLIDPGTKAAKWMAKMGIATRDMIQISKRGYLPVMTTLWMGLQKLSKAEREVAVAQIFEMRAGTAFNAMMTEGVGGLKAWIAEMDKAGGAAQRMAQRRLGTLRGEFMRLKSALSTFSIVVFERTLDAAGGGISRLRGQIVSLIYAMMALDDESGDALGTLTASYDELQRKARMTGAPELKLMDPKRALEAARGILKAVEEVRAGIARAIGDVERFWNRMTGGKDTKITIERIAHIGALIMLISTIAGPAMLALTGVGFAIQGLTILGAVPIEILSGLSGALFNVGRHAVLGLSGLGKFVQVAADVGPVMATKMAVLTSPGLGAAFASISAGATAVAAALPAVGIGAAVVAVAFLGMRKEGESVADTLKRIGMDAAGGLKTFFTSTLPGFFRNVGQQAATFLAPLWQAIVVVADMLTSILRPAFQAVWSVVKAVGAVIGWAFKAAFAIIGAVVYVIGSLVEGVMKARAAFLKWLSPVTKAFKLIIDAIWLLIRLFVHLYVKVLVAVWMAIWKLLEPVRTLLSAVGGGLKKAWESVLPVIDKIGDAIIKVLLWPLRKAAGWIADIIDLVRRMPGIGGKLGEEAADMAARLREFSETGVVRPPAPVPTGVGATDAEVSAQRARPVETNVNVNNQKVEVTTNTTLEVDGRALARAQQMYELEVSDRAGVKITPWQRRALVAQSSALLSGAGG